MNRNKHMRILYGFTKGTNKNEREQALKSLKKSPMAVSLSGYHHSAQYAKILSSYAFVASPSGNGLDCHRSWEALYCGVIPIVKRSVAMEYFVSLGLPIYCVDTWKELEVLSEEKLHMIYNSRRSTFRSPSLYLSYWRKRIGKHI